MPTHPWERRADESEDAFLAFTRFRDLGASRTVVGAFRQIEGKTGAKQAHGRWNRWVKDYDWFARALAWDNHAAAARQEGIDKAARDEAEEWERRRQRQAKDDYDLGRQFLKQARTLAAFPVTTQILQRDGKTTVVEAIDPRKLREAAAIAQIGRQMTWDAIREALPPDDEDDFDPATATVEENRAYLARKGRARKGPDRRA